MNNDVYKLKYLKYKLKYLNKKNRDNQYNNQIGGKRYDCSNPNAEKLNEICNKSNSGKYKDNISCIISCIQKKTNVNKQITNFKFNGDIHKLLKIYNDTVLEIYADTVLSKLLRIEGGYINDSFIERDPIGLEQTHHIIIGSGPNGMYLAKELSIKFPKQNIIIMDNRIVDEHILKDFSRNRTINLTVEGKRTSKIIKELEKDIIMNFKDGIKMCCFYIPEI
jgi:hypothetical protein